MSPRNKAILGQTIERRVAAAQRLCQWAGGKEWPKRLAHLEPVCGAKVTTPGLAYCDAHYPLLFSAEPRLPSEQLYNLIAGPRPRKPTEPDRWS